MEYRYQIILKGKIIVEPEIIVEPLGTPLECPWVASLRATGGGGRHRLGTSTRTPAGSDIPQLLEKGPDVEKKKKKRCHNGGNLAEPLRRQTKDLPLAETLHNDCASHIVFWQKSD